MRIIAGLTLGLASALLLQSVGLAVSIPLSHAVLKSGQHVYVQEKQGQPIVTIDTWVPTGSVNETKETNGIAHFLEHLLFKATEQYPDVGSLDKQLDKRGAEYNAGTSQDFTHFYITIHSKYLEEALKLHASQLCQATIPEQELDKERLVVIEEMNRSDDNPIRQLYESLQTTVFKGHGYGQRTLGPRSVIQQVSREAILDYYHTWYQPSEFHTVLSGDVTPQQAKQLVEEAFSVCQPTKAPVHQTARAPWPTKPTVRHLSKGSISKSYGILAMPAPPLKDRHEALALDMVVQLLGGDDSSQLYQALRNEQQLVSSISASNMTQRYGGLLTVLWASEPEKADVVVRALLDELAQFKAKGVTEKDLAELKQQNRREFLFHQEESAQVANAVGYYASLASVDGYQQYLDDLETLTVDDVNEALNRWLDWRNAHISVLEPQKTKRSDTEQAKQSDDWIALLQQGSRSGLASSSTPHPQTDLRESVPTRRAAHSFASTIKSKQTYSQQLTARLNAIHQPMADAQTVSLRFFLPLPQTIKEAPGLASLLTSTWGLETQKTDEKTLAKLLNRQGMGISVGAGSDYLEVSASSAAEDVDKLLDLLDEILWSPKFDESLVQREKQQLVQGLQRSLDQPSSLASDTLKGLLYPTHWYGHTKTQALKQIPTFTADQLRELATIGLQSSGAVVAVSGRYDTEVLNKRLTAWFGGDPRPLLAKLIGQTIQADKQVALTASSSQHDRPKPKQMVVERPGQTATWILQGWRVPGLRHPDAPALKVTSSLLGMGMSSRLFVELRDKQGLAYAVGSQYATVAGPGSFKLYIGTDPKNEAKVLAGFETQLKRLADGDFTDEELNAAKTKLIGRFGLAHETPAEQGFYPGFYEAVGLGYGYDKQYEGTIDSVSRDDVIRVVQTYLQSKPFQAIVKPAAS